MPKVGRLPLSRGERIRYRRIRYLNRKEHSPPKSYLFKHFWRIFLLVVLAVVYLACLSFQVKFSLQTFKLSPDGDIESTHSHVYNRSKPNQQRNQSVIYPKESEQRNQKFLPPKESAQFLKECMGRHDILWRDNPGKVSVWAGNVIFPTATFNETASKQGQNETAAIILGPIIPKVASTTLRTMSGHINRPIGFRKRQIPKPPRSFQLAVVRHPLDHFISIYREIGWGGNSDVANDAIRFCEATEEERENWFGTMVNNFIRKPFEKQNEHLLPQLHYLQNYYEGKVEIGSDMEHAQQKVSVVDRIDALLHLESWDQDWKLATEQASQFSEEAHEWMHSHIMKNKLPERIPLPKNYSKHSFLQSGDADRSWKPLCGEDGSVPYFRYMNVTFPSKTNKEEDRVEQILMDAQGNLLKTPNVMQLLRYHYGRKHIWKFLPQLCEYLKLDFECFQYKFPVACREVGNQTMADG